MIGIQSVIAVLLMVISIFILPSKKKKGPRHV